MPRPAVVRAIRAVECFGHVTDPATVRALLGMWRWRRQLTDADVAAVVDHLTSPQRR